MAVVNLEAVLAAKEQRAAVQEELRRQHLLPIVSFTVNIPGPEKSSRIIREFLRYAVDRFRAAADDAGLEIKEERLVYQPAGPAAVMAVTGEALLLKEIALGIETDSEQARLLDIDVFDAAGRQITRSVLELPPRRCFVCDNEAVLCRRASCHAAADIDRVVRNWLDAFGAEVTNPWPEAVWDIGSLAVEAMLAEAACTPAPGLVDRRNAGAHSDMDYFTFLKSSSALAGSMYRCAAAGWNHESPEPEILPVLRRIGLGGEARMFRATNGVNTQKGLLFLLGVLTAAAAMEVKGSQRIVAGKLFTRVARICKGLVERELVPLSRQTPQAQLTAGQRLFLDCNITGIRGEMEAGLPSISEVGLPALRQALSAELTLNDALVHTMVHLMTVVEDTTVLNRNGITALQMMRSQADEALRRGGMLTEAGKASILTMDEDFIAGNISPGGVADLVAATYFIHALEMLQYGESSDIDTKAASADPSPKPKGERPGSQLCYRETAKWQAK